MMTLLGATAAVYRARGDGLDCCVFVARVLAAMAGSQDIHRPGTQWWRDANVWDAARPYSSLDAAAEVVEHVTGRSPREHSVFFGGPPLALVAEALSPGASYVIQGWRSNGTGHTFFLTTHDASGWGCVVVESSKSLGLRVGGEPWRDNMRAQFEFTPNRLDFDAGVGIVRLWNA